MFVCTIFFYVLFIKRKKNTGKTLLSLNELGEKLRATIIFGNFESKTQSNSYSLFTFGNVFHWSKFQALSCDVSRTFDLLDKL